MGNYSIDHDYHIHSYLSSCSNDPEQNAERILSYAKAGGYSSLCLTDHFWDARVPGASDWYAPQDFAHVSKSLPLPESDTVRFHFGCEAEMDKHLTLGIADETFNDFSFVIIPTTHLHMTNFTIDEGADVTARATAYVNRLDSLLSRDLPFHRIGIAHLACGLIMRGEFEKVLNAVSDDEFRRLFAKAEKAGVGIEINASDFDFRKKSGEQCRAVERTFGFAKEAGCKFYLGSDAHHPDALDNAHFAFENAISLLGLTEDDKFYPAWND